MEEDDSSSNSSDSSIEDRQVLQFPVPVESSSSDDEIGLVKTKVQKSEAVKIKINLNEPSLKSRFTQFSTTSETNKNNIVNTELTKPTNNTVVIQSDSTYPKTNETESNLKVKSSEDNATVSKRSKLEETESKLKTSSASSNLKDSTKTESGLKDDSLVKFEASDKTDSSNPKPESLDSGETKSNTTGSDSKTLATDSNESKPDPSTSKLEASEYDPKNVHYEGDLAIYTDPKSGYQYKWCKDNNEWLPKGGVNYGFEDDTHTYTDADGVKYFWDVDKNAWFPKIDDDFMAQYQMNYGFIDNKTEEKKKDSDEDEDEDEDVEMKEEDEKEEGEFKVLESKEKGVKRKIEPAPASWFEMADQQNTKVYVSNLPTDITEEEFVDLMQKCGLVMRDVQTGKMKVKLYTVPDTDILKGDGLCTYIKIESVELALNLLDGYLYKEKRLIVERAKFQMKGDYNPNLKPKKKRRKDKDKLKKMQEQLFDWRPEKMRGERAKHERVVIVKNLFEPSLFDREVSLILEYQQDLRDECSKCGDVRRVVLYDRHPEGVAQITMKDPEGADACVTLLNGRWFGQRKLTAEIWDGKTKFKIAETDSEISSRIDNWEKFLEMDGVTKPGVKSDAEDLVTGSEEPRTKAEEDTAHMVN